jgi:hypothetical protein
MNNYTIEQQKMLAEFLGKKVLIEKDVYYKDGKYFINYSMKMSGGGYQSRQTGSRKRSNLIGSNWAC